MAKIIVNKEVGFFDQELRAQSLQERDPLYKLDLAMDWSPFEKMLEEGFAKELKNNAGRPRYGYLMMFKISVLQRYYNMSDEQAEFQIKDRLTFQKFLGLSAVDDVPDARTIWLFREKLADAGLERKLFDMFVGFLKDQQLIAKEGKIIDASFVEVPRQRNSREENAQIKKGETPEAWKNQMNKLRHKDVDARWTKKNQETYYGYKDHVKSDVKNKFIENYTETDASVHDSQPVDQLTKKGDGALHADSAYQGEEIANDLAAKKIENHICEKGYRNHPLTEEQKQNNRLKSKIRCRIEHIFGFITNTMKGFYLRYIGRKRNRSAIGMINLVYNMFRYVQVSRKKSQLA
ncbi:MAG: IS5 family transposase [Verrucomicrobiota bacterium]